jgi:DNA-binding transcriptional LysR family regulator
MDRITSMTTFVKVVDTGGFSSAARALSLSPSVVTNHIQALEERLGVRLLNRSTRKVSLTEVGHAYYDRCIRIIAELDDADQVAEALQSKPRGTLRLNTAVALPQIIAPVIAEFVALYPEASVSIVATGRMVDLVDEGFDLAIRITPTPTSSLIVRRLAGYRFAVYGAPDYFARRGKPERPADLVHHNCMIYSDSPWGAEWHFATSDNDQAVPITGNMQANNAESLLLAAVLGQGLIYTPTFLVCNELKSGRLVPVLSEFSTVERSIDAIYPHRQHLSAKVRSFIDLLAKHFHGASWSGPDGRPCAD